LIGTDASLLTIAKTDETGVWTITPQNTNTDDVTYVFKINATDGCDVHASMPNPMYLHVGCPSNASDSTFSISD
jgi:hypothetical protein